eukprot:Clim_evm32s47 gene=Clim_evmTU32s47
MMNQNTKMLTPDQQAMLLAQQTMTMHLAAMKHFAESQASLNPGKGKGTKKNEKKDANAKLLPRQKNAQRPIVSKPPRILPKSENMEKPATVNNPFLNNPFGAQMAMMMASAMAGGQIAKSMPNLAAADENGSEGTSGKKGKEPKTTKAPGRGKQAATMRKRKTAQPVKSKAKQNSALRRQSRSIDSPPPMRQSAPAATLQIPTIMTSSASEPDLTANAEIDDFFKGADADLQLTNELLYDLVATPRTRSLETDNITHFSELTEETSPPSSPYTTHYQPHPQQQPHQRQDDDVLIDEILSNMSQLEVQGNNWGPIGQDEVTMDVTDELLSASSSTNTLASVDDAVFDVNEPLTSMYGSLLANI